VKKSSRGFSLTEVLLSLVLVVAMGVMLAITLRASARSNHQSGGFLVARTLVSSKLSQLQVAGYAALNGPGLGQSGARIVDGTPDSPTALENAQGAASATFEFTQTNKLGQYFPGESSPLPPRGLLYLAPYAPSKITTPAGDSYLLVRATALVEWHDSNGVFHTFSQTTLVPRGGL
jgi:type II secretory pathway pseudopilin PulG